VHTTGSRPKLVVSSDGHGVVSHAGSRLLADLADTTGLTGAFTQALRRLRPRGISHDPGRIAIDLAVMLADGGETITDLALLRDQPEVFGPIASNPTAWRLLAGIDPAALGALRATRATAREIVWLQADENREAIPASRAGGRELPGLVLDIDATLVTCHSEKEHAAPTYKHGFGYHPLLCFWVDGRRDGSGGEWWAEERARGKQSLWSSGGVDLVESVTLPGTTQSAAQQCAQERDDYAERRTQQQDDPYLTESESYAAGAEFGSPSGARPGDKSGPREDEQRYAEQRQRRVLLGAGRADPHVGAGVGPVQAGDLP